MNERLNNLVGQAKVMAEETLNKQISKNAELDAFAEKFAELIVRECVNRVRSRQMFANEEDQNVDHAFELLIYDIESHFGVKE